MEMIMEYVDDDTDDIGVISPTDGYVVTAILSFLSVTGTAGNALVLYVFSRRKDRLVSTLFILSLAVVDFTTCLVVVPFTIYMEYTNFRVEEDFICKLYHFLITCNVPFSAMVMVAIAIDRYFCICHPWLNAISSRAAKRIIIGLGLLAVCFGVCVACMYGIYHPMFACRYPVYSESSTRPTSSAAETKADNSAVLPCHSSNPDPELLFHDLCSPQRVGCLAASFDVSNLTSLTTTPSGNFVLRNMKTSTCALNNLLLNDEFQFYYHKIHNSVYAVCFFSVMFLYIAIYRSVLKRRQKRQRDRRRTLPTDTYVALSRSVAPGETQPSVVEAKVQLSLRAIEANPSHAGDSPRRFQALSRIPSYDGNLVANMRTAAMLFVVTTVFVFTFLPAWLMIMKWVSFRPTIFYLYFANNAANPVIYSFMNRNFRESLKRLLLRNRAADRFTADGNGFNRSRPLAEV